MNSNNNNNSSNNRMPVIEIDDDIIDLDGQEKTPEEVVYEWDAKIRKQLTNYSIVDNENILVEFMKEYLKSAEDMAHNYDENDSFRRKVLCHTTFFYSYFTELKCCITDNYLDIMEDILTLYCNIELKVVRLLKRKDSNKREYKRRIASVCRRIIHVITVYLLEKTDHMLHVLIKLNNCNSESCIKILNVLYRHFLTEVPVTNFNDESFCRTYILFQKWKQIRKTEEWQEMDETMYKMYKRNADSIRTNDTLKTILMPTCQSTVDVLLQLFRPIRDISDAYFKHIKEKKNIEIEDLDFNIDLGEDDLNPTIDENKENESDDDDVEFMRAYKQIEQNMSILRNNNNNDFEPQVKIKHEKEDEEDEVVFISYTSPSIEQQQVKDLFITEEDSQSSNSLSCTSNTKESTTIPNADNDNPPTPCDSTVQSNSVEISSDMQSPSLQTPLAPSPLSTVKMCSVSTSTENLPDSNSISDDSCVINNDNNNRIAVNNDKSDDSNISGRKIVATRTVEIQADEQAINKNCLYSYGLVTPPSDIPTDDHNTRTVETCVYTDIMSTKQNLQDDNIRSSIEEQDEETIRENETPVQESEDTSDDIHDDIEDYHENEDNAITKDIESARFDSISKPVEIDDNLQVDSIEPVHYEMSTTTTTITSQIQSETTNITNCNEDIDEIETNSSSDPVPHDDHEPICNHFEEDVTTDTGQVDEFSNILNVENDSVKPKDLASGATSKTLEPVNGNTIIKPLNPTQNGHNKILFTSTQTIRNTTLEEFSKFEDNLNWNKAHDNDFDDVLSGPISKMSLNKNHQLINDEKLDFFNANSDILQTKTNNQQPQQQQQQPVIDTSSRSNSPNEMLSPAFETIDDFRIQDFYNNDGPIINVNGGINRLSNTTEPSLSTPMVPASTNHGILKKTSGLKKKTQISFGEDTFYNFHSDEKRTRSSMVRDLLKNDQKLRMDLRVNLQRLPFIENTMKKVVESARMIRVDYDKTTTYINKNDIVRCVSPPPLSWTYRSFDSGRERHNSGSSTVKNRDHLEKKPKKRKSEAQLNLNNPIGVPRKRGFRASKKTTSTAATTTASTTTITDFEKTDNKYPITNKADKKLEKITKKPEIDYKELVNSGAYFDKPFRPDF